MKKSVIIFCIVLLAIVLIIIPLTSNDEYKELTDVVKKITEVNISKTKNEKLSEGFKYTDDEEEYKVYYYGISSVEFIINKNEFDMQKLFQEKILNYDILEEYLDNEYENGKMKKESLYDGETNIYKHDNYSVIVCNTKEGNKDIYFGIKEMSLKDEYCK